MTDADSFYERPTTPGAVPNDPTQGDPRVKQPPYYLSLKMPGQDGADVLADLDVHPVRPRRAARNVLSGYLAVERRRGTGKDGERTTASCAAGAAADTTVPGPGQAHRTSTPTPRSRRQLNLLRQGASKVINGNLLTLPVGGGMLYVQPVYVQS